GFSPNTPQKCDGIRIDPAPSLPWCSGPNPAAAAAPAPADDAPALYPCFHGLCVIPVSGEWLTPVQPNSEVVVLPSAIAPAARSRGTIGDAFGGRLPSCVFEPNCVGMSS